MFRSAITDLMKTDTLIQLLMQTFAGSAVRRMKSSIVTVSATTTANLAITVRACEAGIEDYFLEALTISALEITHE